MWKCVIRAIVLRQARDRFQLELGLISAYALASSEF